MVNFAEIIDRIKRLKLLSADKDFAFILGISAPDFSKRKKSGSLLPLLIDWGIAERVNLDWLLTGKGAPYTEVEVESFDSNVLDDDPEIAELIEMTREIVRSKSNYSYSLMANIRSFHQAMISERKYQDLENRLSQIESNRFVFKQERRKAQRRTENDPTKIPGGGDRRSGQDRRKAMGGDR